MRKPPQIQAAPEPMVLAAYRRSSVWAQAVALILWFLHPAAARAQMNDYSTPKKAALAHRIVVAKCTSVEARKLAGNNIFTFSTFDVLDLIKGPGLKTVSLRTLGGQVGDTVMDSMLDVDFTSGKTYVLFLGKENEDGFQTVGGTIYQVRSTASGENLIDQWPKDITLHHATTGVPYDKFPLSIPLDDFAFSLRVLAQPTTPEK